MAATSVEAVASAICSAVVFAASGIDLNWLHTKAAVIFSRAVAESGLECRAKAD